MRLHLADTDIMCVPTKTFCTFNNKPWFIVKPKQQHHAKEDHKTGEMILYNQARITLTREIRVAKRSYTEKLKN